MNNLIVMITEKLKEVLECKGFSKETHVMFTQALKQHVSELGHVTRVEIGDHVSEGGWVTHGKSHEYSNLYDYGYKVLRLLENWVGAYEDSWFLHAVVVTIHEINGSPNVKVSILYYSDICSLLSKRALSFVFSTELAGDQTFPADDTTPFVHTKQRLPSLLSFLSCDKPQQLTITIE